MSFLVFIIFSRPYPVLEWIWTTLVCYTELFARLEQIACDHSVPVIQTSIIIEVISLVYFVCYIVLCKIVL